MTRGPVPAEAIRKAMTIAGGRGIVLERDHFQRSRLGFFLFCPALTVFVAIRRTRSHLTGAEDCAAEFRTEILYLRRIPLTRVIARELWLLSPWGTWQYFRILDDRVIEIRNTGMPVLQEEPSTSVPAWGVGIPSGTIPESSFVPTGKVNGDPLQ
jgi:hypothetical protein